MTRPVHPQAANIMRMRDGHEAQVTFVELFFDLVYVFAVTQLSHYLLENLTLAGLFQTLVLWLAVWHAWQYTSWAANWLNPEAVPVRLMFFFVMATGLLMAAAIPLAFDERGLVFSSSYVLIQVGRTLFVLYSLGSQHSLTANFRRILGWFCVAGVLWVTGGLFDEYRLLLWSLALAAEYLSMAIGFWFPGLGRSSTKDWTVEGGHLAERWQLFVIVALGESILITGATLSHTAQWDSLILLAVLSAFVSSLAMWWLYFDTGSKAGTEILVHSQNPGRIASWFVYIHVVLVARIIVSAVGSELVIAHPHGLGDIKAVCVLVAGPALYLMGTAAYKSVIYARPPLSHLVGLLALGLITPLLFSLDILVANGVITLLLVVVAGWESHSRRKNNLITTA